uniref:TLDc domain-containing protein n=1 Tax=Leptocylindrus danicus TaxID=163516 RepID=A0A7S2PL69_9STRA|mmetsp:Transcript_438/g.571  ORF Transcript_438/g.571 Transcript_438/m.571 type:complete len:501 (+) Transcript_438:102-1604(+)
MIVNRACTNSGFHNYYTPTAKDKQRNKKKTDASALFKNKKSSGKKATATVRPYLPAVSSKQNVSRSERTRDTYSQITDDETLSTLSRRSVNSMSISGSGDYFYNELRSQASIKGDLALSLDKHADLDNAAAWTNSIELEAASSSPLLSEGLYQKGITMSRRRKKDDDFDFPHWSPDDDEKPKRGIFSFLVNLIQRVSCFRKKRHEKEEEKLEGLAKSFIESENVESQKLKRVKSMEKLGKPTVSLFYPLNPAFEEWHSADYQSDDETNGESHPDDSVDEEASVEPELVAEFVLEHSLDEFPRILSNDVMQEIARRGLPIALTLRKWKRIYSVAKDGDSMKTMLYLVSRYRYTLMVIKSTRGDIFGAFANDTWEERGSRGKTFYGSGQSFLFSVKSSLAKVDNAPICEMQPYAPTNRDQVEIYKWKGTNVYLQMCDTSNDRIAMGGGGNSGSFGLCVEDSFRRGSTGYCETFGNPRLCSDNEFDILDMEMYGFVTAGYHDA